MRVITGVQPSWESNVFASFSGQGKCLIPLIAIHDTLSQRDHQTLGLAYRWNSIDTDITDIAFGEGSVVIYMGGAGNLELGRGKLHASKTRLSNAMCAHPSVGMTTTKDIRDPFVWRPPYIQHTDLPILPDTLECHVEP